MSAITWTREAIAYDNAVVGMTVKQVYDYFGSLVGDKGHSRWSNARPYEDWFIDRFNMATQLIAAFVPPRIELISTDTVSGVALYRLPDYALSTADIRWIRLAGENLPRLSPLSARYSNFAGLDDTAIDTSGTVEAWAQQGADMIRLMPVADGVYAMKVLVATIPDKIDAVDMGSGLVPLPAWLQEAPALYVASQVLATEGRVDQAQHHATSFWTMVKRRADDNVDAVAALDDPHPVAAQMYPVFGGEV